VKHDILTVGRLTVHKILTLVFHSEDTNRAELAENWESMPYLLTHRSKLYMVGRPCPF